MELLVEYSPIAAPAGICSVTVNSSSWPGVKIPLDKVNLLVAGSKIRVDPLPQISVCDWTVGLRTDPAITLDRSSVKVMSVASVSAATSSDRL